MLKPLAIGMLTLTAACSGAAIAGPPPPNPIYTSQSWNSPALTQQQLEQLFGTSWQQILSNPQFESLCAKYPQQCAQWEQWINSWQPPSTGSGNPQPAPEVDPAGAMGALTILGAVLVMVRGRKPAAKPA
jgi:hypothetical protein